ncbi:LuxR C-terminal-related transcriptional regulator [Streptomyces sp. 1268]|uniref:helix-turn-helix transcriptional regulator n=1 Tax=Streptomyces sp. 1268 TaxID=3231942 RepID=UPI0038D3C475
MVQAIGRREGFRPIERGHSGPAADCVPFALAHEAGRRDLFASVFARSGICMAIFDRDLNVIEANTEMLEVLGSPPQHVLGKPLQEMLHPSIRGQTLHRFEQLAAGRHGHVSTRAVFVHSSDSAFTGQLTAVAVESPSRPVDTIVVVVDPDETPLPALKKSTKQLTGLDAQILEGIAAGTSTTQLASRLYLSRQGVEYHVSAMLRKFSVPNRAALVAKAYSVGMFNIGSWPPRILVESVR